ncbi:CDF family Co(II)/Ni(II) efflux transporter DmeF [Neorhizobium galegae]|uniref:CDF family Co(II)/Ni(II) efflux transporter DmeF n=1 Tax=Neorhizobium galegae TaxID=399 RepID=UPI00062226B4|nr:CDF family Co(II)/Ni(II) efflux transporter DmeF [Neorhizobium galegae]CDZ30330.1 Putative metal transporter [Neorhizobium galegae bv. officinalis]KAA9386324.1 CDF family Co(II)/Ni(II) efflux transporter DmeF [Neorhizobium galegae]KAB1112820.1 CDF family Co(II)/Ni(II) efflux transporter DmeF [Neorhizobium galegae]MCM2500731.1 CDF family Co(II)/Ni(II) efflux transporter DmeF [Neorhizobium galegae]MCQ1770690.1 CDF family Co(II)/Ni(II) efflux transporter DmeF [Neorhizobium galegae]
MADPVEELKHEHVFLGADHERNERKVWLVIALTATMMVAEIVAGSIFGSMALTADGWHMSTHAGAMLIAALAYLYARRQARNPRYTFGTGKLGDLAGFASAIVLALIALLIAWESFVRFANPVAIDFDQAILVAVVGLAVNLLSAWLLREDHHHSHRGGHAHHGSHAHDGGHHHGHHGHHGAHAHEPAAKDHNLRAAYLHVLADALTSVLAIVALILGRSYGWAWLDPAMGLVGGLVIARWSWGLIRVTATVLLDAQADDEELAGKIRRSVETEEDRISDLHVWQVGPGHHAAIVALVTPKPQAPSFYKDKLRGIRDLSHVTVEVTPTGAA